MNKNVAKAFVRKHKTRGGDDVTSMWLLTNGLDMLEGEHIYAFTLIEMDGTVMLQIIGDKDATEEARGLTPTQVSL